jgi:hypothetical protein
MTDYRAAAITAVLLKEMRALLVAPSHDNATRCNELMDRLREHDEAAFDECLRQDDDVKLKAVATFVAGIPKRAERQVPASMPRSVEPEPPKPRPVRPQGAYLADFGQHAAREEAGGRFAAVNTFVAPGEIPQYPRQPSTSPWHHDPVPDEPPTGYDLNALAGQEPKTSEPTKDELIKEIARLRAALEAAQSGGAPGVYTVEPTLEEGEPLLASAAPSHNSSAQKEEPNG